MQGIGPEEQKTKTIKEWILPTSVAEVCSFLGLAGYYAWFIPHYAHIAAPLTDLLSKEQSF